MESLLVEAAVVGFPLEVVAVVDSPLEVVAVVDSHQGGGRGGFSSRGGGRGGARGNSRGGFRGKRRKILESNGLAIFLFCTLAFLYTLCTQ